MVASSLIEADHLQLDTVSEIVEGVHHLRPVDKSWGDFVVAVKNDAVFQLD